MRGFIVGTIATAITFAIVSYLLPQIDYGGSIPQVSSWWRSSPAW